MLIQDNRIQVAHHHQDGHNHSHPHAKGDTAVHSVKSGLREIKVVRRVLDVNEKMADENRVLFNQHGNFVLNLMSSPGSGKTRPEAQSAFLVTFLILTWAKTSELTVPGNITPSTAPNSGWNVLKFCCRKPPMVSVNIYCRPVLKASARKWPYGLSNNLVNKHWK